jgi:hypothetical protein
MNNTDIRKYRFYKLIDPSDGSIKYIGYTSMRLTTRMEYHTEVAYYGPHTKNSRWVRSVLDRGQTPIIKLLEELTITKSEALIREEQWIYYHWLQGYPLNNETHSNKFIRTILQRSNADIFNTQVP